MTSALWGRRGYRTASVPPGRAADDVVFVFQPVVPARYACFTTRLQAVLPPGSLKDPPCSTSQDLT